MMTKYKCPLCDFTTKTVSAVKRHMKKAHLGEMKGQCPICNKPFKSKKYADNALKIHLYYKSFKDPQHALLYWLISEYNSTARRHGYKPILEGKDLKQMLEVNDDD